MPMAFLTSLLVTSACGSIVLLCAGDAALYKDLLRKAHGNEVVAKSWLKEICGHEIGTCSDTLIAASEAPLPPPSCFKGICLRPEGP